MRITVNGTVHEVGVDGDADGQRPLLQLLREELGLTGAKYGCGEGACGACTVLVDGAPVRACVTPVTELRGVSVTTVEGLGRVDALHRVQRAFLAESAFQCGYCTPGMVVAAAALLEANQAPTEEEIREALEGNVCRCGAHARIIRAIQVAARMKDAAAGSQPAAPMRDPTTSEGNGAWDLARDDEALLDALGGGLLVVPPAGSAGTWVHVGADGAVTVASGKAEVGQGSTAELRRVAAEELRAPWEAIRVVLADTDRTPYDAGTFGSRTTPDVVPALIAAAATARESLVRIAASQWGTDAHRLTAADACVRWEDGHRAASYAELVAGQRLLERVDPTATGTRPDERRLIGAPRGVGAATEVVTGARRYPTDVSVPGMRHGAVLRPPQPGARLAGLDPSSVDGMPDVRLVHEDGFVGVVAADPRTARQALSELRADWETEPRASDGELVEHLRAHPVTVEGWGGGLDERHGDLVAALATAAVRLNATYTAAYIAHAPLETRAAVARWEGERLTVWTGSQRPFGVREALAAELGIAEERVRVIVPPTGGAYGGKHTAEAAIEAARLARAVDRPVKVRWTREEETRFGYLRPAAVIDIRSGCAPDGTLEAWEFTNVNSGPRAIEPPYRIPNVRVRYQPADSPLRQGSYRALSATANTFAREVHVDEIARKVGVDSVELRLSHLTDERLAAVLEAAADRIGWGSGRDGLGIACSVEKGSRVATAAEVRATPGEVLEIVRIVTAFECGAIIDPDNLANQVEGATVMGLGGALFERICFTDGRVTNASQAAYRVPRFRDVPPIEVVLLDRPDLGSAGGGETPIVAVAPAIANAIFAASGVRLRDLPLLPDGVIPAGVSPR